MSQQARQWFFFGISICLGLVGIPLLLFALLTFAGEVAAFFGAGPRGKGPIGLVLLLASYFVLKWMLEAWRKFRALRRVI